MIYTSHYLEQAELFCDRVAIIDEKIRTERDNIEASRKALKQMDEAVDQTMARSDSERGAERADAVDDGDRAVGRAEGAVIEMIAYGSSGQYGY